MRSTSAAAQRTCKALWAVDELRARSRKGGEAVKCTLHQGFKVHPIFVKKTKLEAVRRHPVGRRKGGLSGRLKTA